jgi:2-dehydro-3-deoxyphosphogluconate aldolase/(4S)-4-hydroxy-2-oxoglutarate aldolase
VDVLSGASQALTTLREQVVVPVLRLPSAALTLLAVERLRQAGFRAFELTLTTPGALRALEELAPTPGLLLGMGTVRNDNDARASVRAGARFLVSPFAPAGVADVAHAAGIPCLLGGLTPGEVEGAARAGADAVKVFPAASVGGAAHIKALKAVFPELDLVPTGGVNLDTMSDYLRAGSAFVGVGSELVSATALQGQAEPFLERARQYLSLGRAARSAGRGEAR